MKHHTSSCIWKCSTDNSFSVFSLISTATFIGVKIHTLHSMVSASHNIIN